jgi:prenyltransferase beta subunit
LQNSSTWFWGGGGNIAEADIPGEILYAFSQSQNLHMLNLLSGVTANLTKFQQANGGFLGYFDTASNKQVTSSVDTAMALLGLISSNSLSLTRVQSAVNYLLSLQNSDGSFNLTKTLRSTSLYSLGPEPISITALVTLALREASVSFSNLAIVSALNYLVASASSSFGGHVYAAALSLLVFSEFSNASEATVADSFILQQQNSDGGFRDVIRSSSGSNALDTGWAAVALQLGGPVCCNGGGGGRRPYIM